MPDSARSQADHARIWAALLAAALFLGTVGCDHDTTITRGGGLSSPPPGPTITTLSASASAIVIGAPLTLTAKVTPAPGTGSVMLRNLTFSQIQLGQLSGNTAVFPSPPLRVGTNVFVASNDSGSIPPTDASTSAPVDVLVSAAGATCGLGLSATTFTSGTNSSSGQTYTNTLNDQNALCAANSGTSVMLTDPTLATGGQASSPLDPSGLGSAVLAYGSSDSTPSGASIDIVGGSVSANGASATAVFATGKGSSVTLTGTSVSGGLSLTSNNGAIIPGDVIGTARGGSVTLNQVTAATASVGGPLLYTGDDNSSLSITGGSYDARTSSLPFAELIGNSSMTITDAVLLANSTVGLAMFPSQFSSATTQTSSLTMIGGTFNYVAGLDSQAFFVADGETATIALDHTAIITPAPANGLPAVVLSAGYGLGSATAAIANLNTANETFSGNISADPGSKANVSLTSASDWTGAFEAYGTATGNFSLAIDSTSTWTVTADCPLSVLSDPAGITGTTITNIVGNGHTVTYDPAKNPALAGQTFSLQGGGALKPAS